MAEPPWPITDGSTLQATDIHRHWFICVAQRWVAQERASRGHVTASATTQATGYRRPCLTPTVVTVSSDLQDIVGTRTEIRVTIESLVRHLVMLVGQTDQQTGKTLLDLTVDGVRCRLDAVDTHVAAAATLSPRESEIVRMVAQGYPNKTIAGVLDISTFTVSSYIRRIFSKLDVNSRAAMVALAIERGLVPNALRPWNQPPVDNVGGR
jgi:DNA-binding CsgD family transcriptional regulator